MVYKWYKWSDDWQVFVDLANYFNSVRTACTWENSGFPKIWENMEKFDEKRTFFDFYQNSVISWTKGV